jgi:threonine dehydrogenase-like Zn-dependent dehydrogenase
MTQQVVFTDHQQAELISVPMDEQPLGAGEVFARTLYSAISAGTETAVYQNQRGDGYPFYPGYAAVCEIGEAGAEVTGIKPGDLAYAMAPHKSHHRLPADSLFPLPQGLLPEEAVLVRLMGVTMSTLVTTTARPPDKVLVSGLGMVGLMGAQGFQACGYDVYAVDPDPNRREAASRLGLRHVFAEPPLDDPTIAGQVSLVVECSGHEAAALAGCQIVRKRGEVVLVGVPWFRKTDLLAHELLHAIFHKYAVVRSGWEWEVPRTPQEFQEGSIQANIAAGLQWLADGRVGVSGLYQLLSPTQCQEAYQGLMQRSLPKPAVVFDWSQLG